MRNQSSTFVHTLFVTSALALATATMGCGENTIEGDGARYPSTGVTDDNLPQTPPQTAAAFDANNAAGDTNGGYTNGPGSPGPEEGYAQEDPYPQDGVTYDGTPNENEAGGQAQQANDSYADNDPSALTDFRPALDPYGEWVEDPTYGTIWVPSSSTVGSDFTPYVSAGHWAYDDDWVWVSDYSWGWAPFHYGRWVYSGARWGWIPGRTYAGAWVSWRTGYDGYGYLGWAPLPPTWYWHRGYAVGVYGVPYAPYAFCGVHDVFRPGFGGGIIAGPRAVEIANHTRPYVPASPTVAGRTAAHPTVAGPTPQSVGIASREVARPSVNNAGLQRAQSMARPSTAVAQGAHAPTVRSNAVASNNSAGRSNAMNSRDFHSTPAQNVRPSAASRGGYGNYGSASDSRPTYQGRSTYSGGRSYGGQPVYRSGGGTSSGTTQAHPAPQAEPSYHPSGRSSDGGRSGGGRSGGGGHHR